MKMTAFMIISTDALLRTDFVWGSMEFFKNELRVSCMCMELIRMLYYIIR